MRGWRMLMAAILILACGVGVVAWSTGGDVNAAAQNQTESRVTFAGEPPAWAGTAESVMTELEQWRGRSFKEKLQVTFQPQAEPGLKGWYNAQTKGLVVTLNGSEKMGRGVLLHELFHGLQDQNFDLYQLRLQSLNQPDRDKALSAIIEGEAMWAVSELLNYDFLAHARLPQAGEVSEERFEKIFLYGAGLKFIKAVHRAGGWKAVDGVFQDPPRSTALILAPERYLAGEREVAAIAVPLNPGETLQAQEVRGEYQVQLLLARLAETRSQLSTLDDAYVADTLGVIKEADNSAPHTARHRWIIELSSPEAAAELQAAFRVALAHSRGGDPSTSVFVNQSTLIAEWSSVPVMFPANASR